MADKLGVYIFKDLYKAYFWVWESTWFVHVGFLLQTLWLCRDMLASKCGVRTCVCVPSLLLLTDWCLSRCYSVYGQSLPALVASAAFYPLVSSGRQKEIDATSVMIRKLYKLMNTSC